MADKEYIAGGFAEGMDAQAIADKHGVPVEHIEEQLGKGTEVEYEHSPDANIAREIAKDHLFESPMYYNYLHEMEEEMEENLQSDIKKINGEEEKKEDAKDTKKEALKRLFG
jgi:hypothetical protein